MSDARKCSNCKGTIEPGDEYVVYGGLCWHSMKCLAEWVTGRSEDDGRIDLNDEYMEKVDREAEWRTL